MAGASLVLYECFAIARRRTTVSDYAHRFPWGIVVWSWWGGLGVHFIREWRAARRLP